jgi:hypothetical protein
VKCGVFFAVRTEFLNSIYTRFGFKGLKDILSSPSVHESSCNIFSGNSLV